MNMHPHSSSIENPPCFVDAHAELEHLRRHYPTTPIFLTGDYNAFFTEPQFEVLFEGLNMTSGMLVAEQSDGILIWNHPLTTMEPFDAERKWTAIDHVGITTDLCDVKLHRILLDEQIMKASDHCPMFVDVALKC